MIRLETFPTYVKTARNLKKSETHKDILMTINAKNACIRMFIWSPCVDPHDRRPSCMPLAIVAPGRQSAWLYFAH